MLERFTLARSVSDLEEIYERCAAPYRSRGIAPREGGYRLAVTFWRSLVLPPRIYALLRKTRGELGYERPSFARRAWWKIKGRIANVVRRVLGIRRETRGAE